MTELDPSAPIRAAAEVTVEAPVAAVWTTLADATGWPSWYPDIRHVDADGPLAAGDEFSFKTGPVGISATVVRSDREQLLHFVGESRGSHAAYVFALEAAGTRTVVRAQQTMSGLAAKAMKPMLQKIADTSLPAWLAALKTAVESGR